MIECYCLQFLDLGWTTFYRRSLAVDLEVGVIPAVDLEGVGVIPALDLEGVGAVLEVDLIRVMVAVAVDMV